MAADRNVQLFRQLDSYQWDSDEEFQSGLRAILGPHPNPDQAEQLTLRARCFYYSRKQNLPIDFSAYQRWHTQQHSSLSNSIPFFEDKTIQPSEATAIVTDTAASSNDPPPPYPMSFNHIVELITTGQPIPGVKEIPDTVLDGQATQATHMRRNKPWEKAGNDEGSATIAALGLE